ncbi:MAG: hypothetical protein FD131_5135 [Rhodocyclaceae bacterium]|nr:MAG: hypothetical protein FD131_5135 [Rhodocyclaceae bacterium]
MTTGQCAILHTDAPGVRDTCGCRLPCGHPGPHEFVADDDQVYQWETDWGCDCEDCLSGEGDFCTIYWRVESDANPVAL